MRSRLAVECDGDQWHGLDKWEEDIERQRVLERVGWTFWRVRGSQFYLDPEKAMSSLWEKLDEMGIYPIVPKENAVFITKNLIRIQIVIIQIKQLLILYLLSFKPL